MQPLDSRIKRSDKCRDQGRLAEREGDLTLAYRLFTQAHDLIMDCPRHHQRAHEELRRVNWKVGHYGELMTDWLLHVFAPLGVFELVSYLARTEAFSSAICKRGR